MVGRRKAIDEINVRTPCKVPWDSMTGDERKRFCSECKLHVVNLSSMNEQEATALLQSRSKNGRTCVGFYRRNDGTIVFEDCGALKRVRSVIKKLARIVAGACAFVISISAARADSNSDSTAKRNGLPLTSLDTFIQNALNEHELIYGEVDEASIPLFSNPKLNESKAGQGTDFEQIGTGGQLLNGPDKIKMLTESLDKHPTDAQLYVSRAWEYKKLGKPQLALEDCAKALKINPTCASAYDTKGHIELTLKSYDAAVEDFSRAIALDSSLGSSYYFRAEAYEAIGKIDLARADRVKSKELGYPSDWPSSP